MYGCGAYPIEWASISLSIPQAHIVQLGGTRPPGGQHSSVVRRLNQFARSMSMTLPRGNRRRDGWEAQQRAIMLAVATGLLSAGPTAAFAPLSLGWTRTGLRRRSSGEVVPQVIKNVKMISYRGARMCKGLQMLSGVAKEEAIDTSWTGTTPEVVKNNMTPFVAVPRREPKEWFEAVKTQAGPRPDTIAELSK